MRLTINEPGRIVGASIFIELFYDWESFTPTDQPILEGILYTLRRIGRYNEAINHLVWVIAQISEGKTVRVE